MNNSASILSPCAVNWHGTNKYDAQLLMPQDPVRLVSDIRHIEQGHFQEVTRFEI